MVIGSKKLARLQFEYEGDRPPFIFASTPEEALGICQQLLLSTTQRTENDQSGRKLFTDVDKPTIDELRQLVIEWYVRIYQNINRRVRHTLKSLG